LAGWFASIWKHFAEKREIEFAKSFDYQNIWKPLDGMIFIELRWRFSTHHILDGLVQIQYTALKWSEKK
jgi:hypothetical protein